MCAHVDNGFNDEIGSNKGKSIKKTPKRKSGDSLCGTDKPCRILNTDYVTIKRRIFEITSLYLLSDELKTNYKVIKMSIHLQGREQRPFQLISIHNGKSC